MAENDDENERDNEDEKEEEEGGRQIENVDKQRSYMQHHSGKHTSEPFQKRIHFCCFLVFLLSISLYLSSYTD